MTSNEILRADVLDILFEKRNKEYGAYTLRKNYSQRLALALAIGVSTGMLLFLFCGSHHAASALYKEDPGVIVRQFFIPKVEAPKPVLVQPAKVHPPQAPVAQKMLTSIKLVSKDVLPTNVMPPIKDMINVAVSDHNETGTPVPASQTPVATSGNGNSTAPAKKDDVPGTVIVDQMPEFPGGMAAWSRFLNNNLRVPDELEPDEKKTVLVSFQVDALGNVTGFRVVQSAGSLFDNEVIRVLKKMPKWKPALQAGHPVSVQFTQPVTFLGLEK